MDTVLIEDDPIPPTLFVVEANSAALATLGVVAEIKPLSMASLGTFGAASPTPIVAHGKQNEMLIGVGEMM